ncbi:MAG: aromatic acid/H+ symport family MFS transporter [Leifsonia sp.]
MDQTTTNTPGRTWPIILCWLVVALDGFDLVVLGTVIPTLLKTEELGFDPAAATFVATLGLVGVGLGALIIGPLTDSYGRRRALLACVAVFSLGTIAIVFAPNVVVFALLRFVAGLGLGACLPTALAYVSELAPSHRNARSTTLTMTGYHIGAVLTALLALVLIPDWRLMFMIGGVAGLLVLPLLWYALPESSSFVKRDDLRDRPAGSSIATLLSKRYRVVSLGIWVASFMGLLLVYGLNTWMPQIMASAGYDTGNSLAFLLVLNVGAVTGLLIAGALADKRGTKRIAIVWFLLAAVFLALLSIRMDAVILLYVAVFITGVFVFSAQVLVYAFVNQLYPPEVRGTALGFAAGIGRAGAIAGPAITGLLVTLNIVYPGGFYVFAISALLAVVGIALVPSLTRGVHPGEPALASAQRSG